MTLREKIGQLFIFGFQGTRPSKGISELIKDTNIGGIILFKRNLKDPPQIARLTNTLQSYSRFIPLFISIDQEGGRISRLPKGFTCFPSASAFGLRNNVELTYRASEITASELQAVGINLNFSPVLDILTQPDNPVIGDRAFGLTPTVVASMGLAVMAGLQDNRVIACGKHFPGHGDTQADSHLELPRINRSIAKIQTEDTRPFSHLISNGLAMIMTAHVLFPSLDKKSPATLSKKIIDTLLRKALGFTGVVVTDDLEMKAITQDPGEAAIQSLLAGADLILICHDELKQRKALEAVQKAVKDKRISEARIDQSILRVLSLKERFILPYHPTTPNNVRATVGRPSHRLVLNSIKEVGV